MRYLPLVLVGCCISVLACNKKQKEPALGSEKPKDTDRNITIDANSYRGNPNGNVPYTVSPATIFSYDGLEVRVKAYSRNVGDQKNSPIFKYGDLINRAIAYKLAHGSTSVKIKYHDTTRSGNV